MSKEKVLKNNWKILKFSECIEQLNTGLNPRNHFSLGKGNIKYITAKNLTKLGTIDFSKCDFIDEKAKFIINRRSDIKIGDILFSSRAPIGHCHLIKAEPNYFDIGESIFSIRVNKEIVLPEYLCLYLSSDYFIKLASKNTTGSIIQEIRISDLMNTDIIIPPKDTQKCIAESILNVDKKIELNNKINAELEAMAKTIYDYWFLQFEFPNEEGKPYKSSGGKMVWNEELKREIPEGWEVETLLKNRLSSFIKTGVEYFEEKNYLATANIVNEEISDGNWITYENRENRANMTPMPNSIWFAKMKNSIKHLTLTNSVGWFLEKYILSTGFIGIKCKENTLGYLHCFINSQYFELKKDSLAHGATQEAVNNEDLNSIKLLIPSYNILNSFNKRIVPLLQKKIDNVKENQELTSLRDFLLPLLMNGQVGFKEEK